MTAAPKTLAEIAKGISRHLSRIESNPDLNKPYRPDSDLRPFYQAHAWASGRYVGVTYVSYRSPTFLSKVDAAEYLEWLDSGGSGYHFEFIHSRQLDKRPSRG